MAIPELPVPPEAPAPKPKKFPWGCVIGGGCFGLLLVGAAVVALILVVAFSILGDSEPARHAFALASANEMVTEKLGDPLEQGTFTMGDVAVDEDGGKADLTVPISGPKGSGTIVVKGTRQSGQWDYSTLEVTIPGQEPINLQE